MKVERGKGVQWWYDRFIKMGIDEVVAAYCLLEFANVLLCYVG